jgi:hypothetical protein
MNNLANRIRKIVNALERELCCTRIDWFKVGVLHTDLSQLLCDIDLLERNYYHKMDQLLDFDLGNRLID